jgi:hypothetical protein
MADSDIEGRGWSLEKIREETGVDVGLLVVEVETAAIGLLSRKVVGEELSFQALGEVVFEF